MDNPTSATTQLLEASDFGPSSSTTTGAEKGDFIAQIIGCIVVLVIIVATMAHFGYFSKKKEETKPKELTEVEKAIVMMTNIGNGTRKYNDTIGNDDFKKSIGLLNMNVSGMHKELALILRQLDTILNDAQSKKAYENDGTQKLAQESVKTLVTVAVTSDAMIISANEKIVQTKGVVDVNLLFPINKEADEGMKKLPDNLKAISEKHSKILTYPEKLFR